MGRSPGRFRHGSYGGWSRHAKEKSRACGGCLAAIARYQEDRRNRGKCAKGLGWPLSAR